MRESDFQKNLIKEIKKRFPNSMVYKLDAKYRQGSPDLLVLNGKRWATLECKKSYKEYKNDQRPNQDYYVARMNKMSFSSFIYPENREEVLNEMEKTFRDS